MSRTSLLVFALVLWIGAGTSLADDYSVLVDGTNIFTQSWPLMLLDVQCFEGSTAYCIFRGKIQDLPSPFSSEWGSEIVRIDNIDTTPTTRVLLSNAQWKSFLGLNINGTDCDKELYYWALIQPGDRVAIVGDYLQYLDYGRSGYAPGATEPNCETNGFNMDAVYRVNKDTGAISVFVSNQAFKTFLGMEDTPGEAPNNPKFNSGAVAFSSTGEMAVYEVNTHSLILIDAVGNLSLLISRAEFQSYYAYEPINAVSALAFDSQGRLYWGLNGGNGGASGAIHRRNCDGTFVKMINQQDIWAVTGGSTRTLFFDIYVGPDDRLYFYDGGSGSSYSILHFDVNDVNLPHTGGGSLPVGVVQYYLMATQLTNGPGGSKYVSNFNSWGSNLVWSTGLSPATTNDIYFKPLAGPCCQNTDCTCPWLPLTDFDRNRKVDADDLLMFAACATGPSIPYAPSSMPPGCSIQADCHGVIPADADSDGDVDAADFASFQRTLMIGLP